MGDLRFAIGLHVAFNFDAIFVHSGSCGGHLAPDRLLTAPLHRIDRLTGGKPRGKFALPAMGAMFLVFDRIYRSGKPSASP